MRLKTKVLHCAASILGAGCIIGLSAPDQAHAGAWTMGKGKMYNKVAVNYFKSTETYDHDGDTKDMPYDGKFEDLNLNWYQEYGITDNVTFLSSLYYKWLEEENNYIDMDSKGVGDVEFGVKFGVTKDVIASAFQITAKFNGMYDRDATPGIGNDQKDLEFRLLLGKSLYPLPMYVGLEGAWKKRFEAPADEWKLLLEVGGNYQKFYARAKLDATFSADNADDMATYTNVTLSPQYDLGKLDMTIGMNITEKIGAEVSYVPTLWGEDTAAGYTLSAALIYQF